jgi:hypothetical protein
MEARRAHRREEEHVSDSTLDIGAGGPAGSIATPPVSGPGAAADPGRSGVEAGTLVLTPPAPVAPVRDEQASSAVKLDSATVAKLDGMVASYLDAVTSLDPHAPEFTSRANDIRKLGDEDIRASAAVSNRLLDRPTAAMTRGGISETSEISKSLISLRRTVEDLDPGHQGDLL